MRVLGLEFVQQAVGLGTWAVVVGDSYAIGTVDATTVARLCLLRWGRCLLLRSFLWEGLGGDVLDLCAGVASGTSEAAVREMAEAGVEV